MCGRRELEPGRESGGRGDWDWDWDRGWDCEWEEESWASPRYENPKDMVGVIREANE